MQAWSPIVAGVVVGLLQIPVRLVSGNGIGSSTAMMALVVSILGMKENKF